MSRWVWLGLGAAALAGAALAARPARWALLNRALDARHPDVAWVSTEALAAELAGPRPPTLLDVREPSEVAVSRIPGAVRVGSDASDEALAALGLEGPVVVYCAVGARSAVLAERLRALGVDGVRNLRGSIFAWANEGRPLVRGDGAASTVHPYDATWGTYLIPSARADLGPETASE